MKNKKNKNKDDVRLERVYEKQITVFGKPLKIKRLMLIAMMGVLLGLSGYYEIHAIGWLIFAFIFFLLGAFSILLYVKSIIYFGEKSLECTPAGDIFITKLFGQCTICLGDLKIVKNSKGTFIQCQEDKNHIWDVKS